MGVLGLWNLIEDSATSVNIETLRGKTLAIDLSIWINQSIKGFRDKEGREVANSHVLGLFYRLCKLLHFEIKPIFVFDGDCSTLKRHTHQKRLEQRNKALLKSKSLSLAVLEGYLQSQLMASIETSPVKATSPTKVAKNLSPTKATVTRNRLNFKEKSRLLSDQIEPSKKMQVYTDFALMQKEFQNSISDEDEEKDTDEDDHFEEVAYNLPPQQNIRDIDINSQEFKNLPPETRYEILVELRESYKGRKNPFPERLPSDALVFSNYQMQKLLKKRNLQEEIDRLVDELNGVVDDSVELIKSNAEIFDQQTNTVITTGRLASDERTRFILIKGNKAKKIEEDEEKLKEEEPEVDPKGHENLAYRLPNIRPGESDQADKCARTRIEMLSQCTSSSQSGSQEYSNKFKPIELGGHFEKKIKKYTDIKPTTSSKPDLSEDDTSSTEDSDDDTDDFIEVAMEEEEEEESEMENIEDTSQDLQLFDEAFHPFTSDFSIPIVVDEQDGDLPKEGASKLTTTIEVVQNELEDKEDVQSIETVELVESNQPSAAEKIHVAEKAAILESNTTTSTIEESQPEDTQSIEEIVSTPSTTNQTKATETADAANIEATEPAPTKVVSMDNLIEAARESAKLTRQAASVSDRMISDCQELLRLFGVPYVVAPGEAEAQCAALEELSLVDGIITDDSDVFLFGGQLVYRNFFSNIKSISRYTGEDLQTFYGLNRSKLICLGMICGTDYTVGIEQAGPVTALEILSQFDGDELEPLQNFARWYRDKLHAKDARPENSVREKLLRLMVPSSFPSRMIYEAYRYPNVDTSRQPFSWSLPQLSELRSYARYWFGWAEARTDAHLLPVLKNLNERKTQTKIDYYFSRGSSSAARKTAVTEKLQIKRSKRLNAAIQRNLRETEQQFGQLNQPKSGKSKSTKRKPKAKKVKPKFKRKTEEEVQLSEESSSDD